MSKKDQRNRKDAQEIIALLPSGANNTKEKSKPKVKAPHLREGVLMSLTDAMVRSYANTSDQDLVYGVFSDLLELAVEIEEYEMDGPACLAYLVERVYTPMNVLMERIYEPD